jgi:hypothetical protein
MAVPVLRKAFFGERLAFLVAFLCDGLALGLLAIFFFVAFLTAISLAP